jgi:hypothetical protein
MAIWLRGLERWYLLLGGVAVGRGFEPQSNLELSFAQILIYDTCQIRNLYRNLGQTHDVYRMLGLALLKPERSNISSGLIRNSYILNKQIIIDNS